LTDAETRTGSDTTRAMTTNNLNNTMFSAVFNGDATPSNLFSNVGASGWTISNSATGINVITHSLGLTDVGKLLIVATTSDITIANANVSARATNDFTITTTDMGATNVDVDFTVFCWLVE